jgi:hypothetical protein
LASHPKLERKDKKHGSGKNLFGIISPERDFSGVYNRQSRAHFETQQNSEGTVGGHCSSYVNHAARMCHVFKDWLQFIRMLQVPACEILRTRMPEAGLASTQEIVQDKAKQHYAFISECWHCQRIDF